ncbi:hypothetical protein IVB03_14015 [Bradyrhizobium sp. 168]|uniref:hypothetical protein n=1 Tax=Bradyrhizobium sp. 168 TaxID=2782639 RepID=UPI001FFAFB35|nr:hypothetical protein [Bradyrhizobium sp. 168]MCK1580667.1 hypothetical protein [Bradyrhizobium sp. 168]
MLDAEFPDQESRASLHFNTGAEAPLDEKRLANEFDRDWGGDIVSLGGDGNYAFFAVGAQSCIRVKLN